MIGAMASGTSHVKNYSTSADCAATLSCLQKLGVRIERDNGELVIRGAGRNGLLQPDGDLDCGNSGTTMRLLSGILAGSGVVATVTGDQSLRSRPMQRIIEPLELMGAEITADDGCAPLRIQGRQSLTAIEYELLTASAQVKSCILFAALRAHGKTIVVENQVTRDHTERMLGWFGAPIETGKPEREPQHSRFASVIGPAELVAHDISIPGDISAAAYFIAAAALLPKSALEVIDIGVNPTRIAYLEELRRMGFTIDETNRREHCNEPIASVTISDQTLANGNESASCTIASGVIPQLIDELPLLAVVGSQIPGGIEIRNAEELRVKESDRIAATVAGLRAMGGEVEEFEDGLRVAGRTKLRGARIDTRGDHRIAMSFAIAGLIAEGETEVVESDCVAVSFPEFFGLLESVVEK